MDTPAALRHVRIKGMNTDRRMRWAMKRKTVSDGRTFCGAEGTSDDVSKDNALGTLRIAAAKRCVGRRAEADAMVSELCPACLAELPSEG